MKFRTLSMQGYNAVTQLKTSNLVRLFVRATKRRWGTAYTKVGQEDVQVGNWEIVARR